MMEDLLRFDDLLPGLAVLPVRHGSLPFAEAARRVVLSEPFDRLALDLPIEVGATFLESIEHLPEIRATTWIQGDHRWILPCDPCEAAVVAARAAIQERKQVVFVDDLDPVGPEDDPELPDPAAVETLGAAEYAGLCLPFLDKIRHESSIQRARRMAARLRALPGRTLLVLRLPLLAELMRALREPDVRPAEPDEIEWGELEIVPVDPRHLLFCLGEWPFVAQEAERRRADPFLQMPNLHRWPALTMAWARDRHLERKRAKFLPVHELRSADRFAHRLARFSGYQRPSMWDLVQAVRGCSGDSFAAAVLEAAQYHGHTPQGELLRIGPARARVGTEPSRPWIHRLNPNPVRWSEVRLRKDPDPAEATRWIRDWKPSSLCSHLPEDIAIERFNRELRERAKSSSPSAQQRSSRYESSLLDGLDLRETVRNFWKGEIWVKENPPKTLRLDAVVICFDDGTDDEYPHQGTWYAEHKDESTLLFFATDPVRDPIGPGILRCRYGGLGLFFPPRHVPDVFSLEPAPLSARTPLEKLVAGSCLFARERSVAFASWTPPSLALQAIAHDAGKRLVHVPLSGFPARTLDKLRTFHVLNGKDVRGWADRFIQG